MSDRHAETLNVNTKLELDNFRTGLNRERYGVDLRKKN